jgi:hypothetical protein
MSQALRNLLAPAVSGQRWEQAAKTQGFPAAYLIGAPRFLATPATLRRNASGKADTPSS